MEKEILDLFIHVIVFNLVSVYAEVHATLNFDSGSLGVFTM